MRCSNALAAGTSHTRSSIAGFRRPVVSCAGLQLQRALAWLLACCLLLHKELTTSLYAFR